MIDANVSELDLTEMSRADLYDMIEAQASQLLAMKGALEDIASAPCFGFYGGFRKSLVDRAKRALLSTSAADKIAEGLRDAIAIGGTPNSGGGYAVCDDCGNRHDPYIRCPNYHAGMMPSAHPNPSEKE
jgi:hypothetical protein